MNEKEFKERTKQLALAIIRLVEDLPSTKAADFLGRQMLRSATSIGANYRPACRAKSTADMINKLKMVEEENDETLYWWNCSQRVASFHQQEQPTCIKKLMRSFP